MFLAQVFQRLQQNRAAGSCAAGRLYPVQGAGTHVRIYVVERPAHQVSPPLSARKLAGVRYQLETRDPAP